MTRILLRRDLASLGYAGSTVLNAPWAWWETRVYPAAEGNLLDMTQEPDGNFTVTFGPDGGSVVLTDPPSVHLLQVTNYDDRYSAAGLDRVMINSQYVVCRVVWHESPGPQWQIVAGRLTCRPADYRHDSSMSDRGGRAEFTDWSSDIISRDTPELQWPIVPTVRDDGLTVTAYTWLPGDDMPSVRPVPMPPQRYTETRRIDTGAQPDYEEALRSTQQEIAAAFAVPPATLGQTEPASSEDYMRAIYEARTAFMLRAYRNPVAILMHPEDYRRLLMMSDNTGRPLYEYRPGVDQPGTVMGLEVRIDRNVTPGQVIVIGEDLQGVASDVRNPVGMAPRSPRREEVYTWGGDLVGYVGSRRPPLVKPESEVVDEIDRLVNDQVRPGPRDDYNIDRYPKCADCDHDWHGLGCESCDCVNTEWLKSSGRQLDFGKATPPAAPRARGRDVDL